MRNDKPNLIVDKTFQYALKVLDYAEKLYAMKRFARPIRSSGQAHLLELMYGRRKMQKVKRILYIR